MLYDYCLNHMTEDELRNYAHHMNEIEDDYGNLVHACNEEIDLLRHLYNERGYHQDALNRLNLTRTQFIEFENEMREKYKEYYPHPVCECNTEEIAKSFIEDVEKGLEQQGEQQ